MKERRFGRKADLTPGGLHLDFGVALDIGQLHILAFIPLGMVTLAETGCRPVDNPATHLALTMIHEGMMPEYSGPTLALTEWASAIERDFMGARHVLEVVKSLREDPSSRIALGAASI
jgi:hypothetical protein